MKRIDGILFFLLPGGGLSLKNGAVGHPSAEVGHGLDLRRNGTVDEAVGPPRDDD